MSSLCEVTTGRNVDIRRSRNSSGCGSHQVRRLWLDQLQGEVPSHCKTTIMAHKLQPEARGESQRAGPVIAPAERCDSEGETIDCSGDLYGHFEPAATLLPRRSAATRGMVGMGSEVLPQSAARVRGNPCLPLVPGTHTGRRSSTATASGSSSHYSSPRPRLSHHNRDHDDSTTASGVTTGGNPLNVSAGGGLGTAHHHAAAASSAAMGRKSTSAIPADLITDPSSSDDNVVLQGGDRSLARKGNKGSRRRRSVCGYQPHAEANTGIPKVILPLSPIFGAALRQPEVELVRGKQASARDPWAAAPEKRAPTLAHVPVRRGSSVEDLKLDGDSAVGEPRPCRGSGATAIQAAAECTASATTSTTTSSTGGGGGGCTANPMQSSEGAGYPASASPADYLSLQSPSLPAGDSEIAKAAPPPASLPLASTGTQLSAASKLASDRSLARRNIKALRVRVEEDNVKEDSEGSDATSSAGRRSGRRSGDAPLAVAQAGAGALAVTASESLAASLATPTTGGVEPGIDIGSGSRGSRFGSSAGGVVLSDSESSKRLVRMRHSSSAVSLTRLAVTASSSQSASSAAAAAAAAVGADGADGADGAAAAVAASNLTTQQNHRAGRMSLSSEDAGCSDTDTDNPSLRAVKLYGNHHLPSAPASRPTATAADNGSATVNNRSAGGSPLLLSPEPSSPLSPALQAREARRSQHRRNLSIGAALSEAASHRYAAYRTLSRGGRWGRRVGGS